MKYECCGNSVELSKNKIRIVKGEVMDDTPICKDCGKKMVHMDKNPGIWQNLKIHNQIG